MDAPAIRIGGPEDALGCRDHLHNLYERDGLNIADESELEKYRELYSVKDFERKLYNDWIRRPNFRIVTAWSAGTLAGFICGSSLAKDPLLWQHAREAFSEEFASENGQRTLHIVEFVVKESMRGHGLGRKLHDALLDGRKEDRVTLLCKMVYQPAYSIYLHWGYVKIGTFQTDPADEVKDILSRPLKGITASAKW